MSDENMNLEVDGAAGFADRLLGVLNDGALCLMISIGHRSGLFDTMRTLLPSTSGEIAERSGLNERYVREWLGAMVTSRIISYNPEASTYVLPSEHAAFLTRPAAADNIAVFAQYISLLGAVEDDILECFQKGGGVPYEKFPRFHAVMAEDSGQSALSTLESHILPLIPKLSERLAEGIDVLDVGCGRGMIITRMAAMHPHSRFTGIDLSDEAIQFASENARKQNLQNVRFIKSDLSDFHKSASPETYDLIATFDAIHDQSKPMNVLKGIHRALKQDGVYLMQEISGSSSPEKNIHHPIGTFLYTVSCMHCMTVSLAQNGEGLGAMWGEEKTREYLTKAGFRSIQMNRLAHDIQNNWYVVRK